MPNEQDSQRLDYDVVVAGASASGLYAARLLAQAGRRVAVFERRRVTGEPKRTWIVTAELRRLLNFDPGDAVVHRVDQMMLLSRRQSAVVRLREPDLIVERSVMLSRLAQMAKAAGAEIYLRRHVRHVAFSTRGLQIAVLDSETGSVAHLRSQHLVGADGTLSQVAACFGARAQVVVPIVQATVRLPAGYDPGLVQVWFERESTRFFYWLIPESPNCAVLGLVADTPGGARHVLDDFCSRHHFEPLEYEGAVIPLHQPTRRIDWRQRDSRVLLVGDAAGHVKVTTVGGLVSGVWGAQAAARSIIHGSNYRQELTALHRELYLHDLIRWLLDRFTDRDYDHLLSALNGPLSRLLSNHNRDSMANVVWQLLASQPLLPALAAKAIVRPYRLAAKRADRGTVPGEGATAQHREQVNL
jgi:digeranylgeranylglycerophospholipid reductase